jgi:multiple sugar transport system substrate-binding protein
MTKFLTKELRMKARVIVAVCVLVMISPFFLFSGGKKETKAAATAGVKDIVIYWNPDHLYKVYDKVIADFAKEKGLNVSKQVLNWNDFKTKLNADLVAGTPPDLIEVPSPWIAEYGAGGQLADLTKEIKSWPDSKDWFESTWVETAVKDKIYGMKLHHTCFGIFYNRSIFKKAGLDPDKPPKDIEEMIKVIDVINGKLGPDVMGFGFDPTGQYLIPFMDSAETPLLIKGNKVAVDTPTIRKTLKALQGIARSNKVFIPEPGGEEARTNVRLAFLTGRIAMMISGPWEIGSIKKDYPDLDYGVAMVPHLAGVEPLTLTAGTGLAIPKGSKLVKDIVWELMKRLTSVDVEVAATLEAGMLMPRATWVKDPRIQAEKVVKLFGPILPLATPFDIDVRKLGLPEITWGGAVFKKLYETMIYSDKDMDKALDEYIQESNKLIAGKM